MTVQNTGSSPTPFPLHRSIADRVVEEAIEGRLEAWSMDPFGAPRQMSPAMVEEWWNNLKGWERLDVARRTGSIGLAPHDYLTKYWDDFIWTMLPPSERSTFADFYRRWILNVEPS